MATSLFTSRVSGASFYTSSVPVVRRSPSYDLDPARHFCRGAHSFRSRMRSALTVLVATILCIAVARFSTISPRRAFLAGFPARKVQTLFFALHKWSVESTIELPLMCWMMAAGGNSCRARRLARAPSCLSVKELVCTTWAATGSSGMLCMDPANSSWCRLALCLRPLGGHAPWV